VSLRRNDVLGLAARGVTNREIDKRADVQREAALLAVPISRVLEFWEAA